MLRGVVAWHGAAGGTWRLRVSALSLRIGAEDMVPREPEPPFFPARTCPKSGDG